MSGGELGVGRGWVVWCGVVWCGVVWAGRAERVGHDMALHGVVSQWQVPYLRISFRERHRIQIFNHHLPILLRPIRRQGRNTQGVLEVAVSQEGIDEVSFPTRFDEF